LTPSPSQRAKSMIGFECDTSALPHDPSPPRKLLPSNFVDEIPLCLIAAPLEGGVRNIRGVNIAAPTLDVYIAFGLREV
jgi:hypothetical protein